MPVFRHASPMPFGADALFRWHDGPTAFERLTPPWEHVEIVERPEPLLRDGARLVLRMRVAPGMTLPWVARHEDVRPGEQFVDVQEQGPFRSWRHVHRFEARGADR